MRKLAVFVMIFAAAGFLFHRVFLAPSEVAKTYEQFAEALAYQNFERAIELADGPARNELQLLRARSKVYGSGATYAVTGTSYKVDSETKKSRDEVELQMTQVVRVNGGGQESAFGRAAASVHNARLKKGPDGWKVISFKEKLVEPAQ